MKRRVCSAALALSLVALARQGACETNEERVGARAAAAEGAKALAEKRYTEAIDYFKRAESLVHAPPHLLYLARAQAAMGLLVDARENLLAVMHEELKPDAPQAFRTAKDTAAEELKAVDARLPYVTVTVKNAPTTGLQLTQDGATIPATLIGIPRPVDPGNHKFDARAPGLAATASVDVKESQRQRVVLELAPAGAEATPAAAAAPTPAAAAPPATPPGEPAPAAATSPAPEPQADSGSGPSGMRIGAYVGLGVGVVGLAAGTIFAFGSKSKSDESNTLFTTSNCAQTGCPSQKSKIDDLDSQSKSQQTLATVGFIVGGLGLATGATLFFLSSGDSKATGSAPKPHVALGIGPGSMLVNGTF